MRWRPFRQAKSRRVILPRPHDTPGTRRLASRSIAARLLISIPCRRRVLPFASRLGSPACPKRSSEATGARAVVPAPISRPNPRFRSHEAGGDHPVRRRGRGGQGARGGRAQDLQVARWVHAPLVLRRQRPDLYPLGVQASSLPSASVSAHRGAASDTGKPWTESEGKGRGWLDPQLRSRLNRAPERNGGAPCVAVALVVQGEGGCAAAARVEPAAGERVVERAAGVPPRPPDRRPPLRRGARHRRARPVRAGGRREAEGVAGGLRDGGLPEEERARDGATPGLGSRAEQGRPEEDGGREGGARWLDKLGDVGE